MKYNLSIKITIIVAFVDTKEKLEPSIIIKQVCIFQFYFIHNKIKSAVKQHRELMNYPSHISSNSSSINIMHFEIRKQVYINNEPKTPIHSRAKLSIFYSFPFITRNWLHYIKTLRKPIILLEKVKLMI